MTDALRIALAQVNPTMGDIEGNAALIRSFRAEAAKAGADLVLFPELVLCGYPPEDLALKPSLQRRCAEVVEALAAETADGGPGLVVGTPWLDQGKLYNAALLLDGGRIVGARYKHDLPNYGVFDEKRVFVPGPMPGPVVFRGVRIGLPICEDIWTPDVVECLQETGAELLLVPNGSPFELDKWDQRQQLTIQRVVECGLPIAYVNQVGGQDELVFDGASFVIGADKALAVQMPAFESALAITDWSRGPKGWTCAVGERVAPISRNESIWQAMVLGLKDYVRKNRFPGVVLGLSGGIDSAVTAAVAVDALGPDKVWCVMLPYRYTSTESLEDAEGVAKLLGIRYDSVAIGDAVEAVTAQLSGVFAGRKPDTTEENIQSRMRGLTLMAISNKFGHMVLTTGNKSENSVGYATLYGDMCGGYNVLKDLYKTTVFEVSRWRNQTHPKNVLGPAGRVMPERVIEKPPSAELRPDQRDEDSLLPYPELDDILQCLVEGEMAVEDIVARGHTREAVKKIERLLYLAEYKRRQAAPGVKITRKQFGRERRYPIVNAFRD